MQELSFIHVQLCDGLVDGGVTPSLGKIGISCASFEVYQATFYVCFVHACMAEAVCEAVTIPVHVLIRPRPGDFCYSADEANIMLRDIRHCKLARVRSVPSAIAGVLFFVLTVVDARSQHDCDTVINLCTAALSSARLMWMAMLILKRCDY